MTVGMVGFLAAGCGVTGSVAIVGVGSVPRSTLCSSNACGAQGTVFIPAKGNSQPLQIASVEKFLGTKLPRASIFANPDNCGGYISAPQWFSSAPLDRTIDLDSKNRSELAAGLKGELSKKLGDATQTINAKADLTAAIDRATEKAVKAQYHYIVTTYTLVPDAYQDRVRACHPGMDEHVVRSVTIVEASTQAANDIKGTLSANLSADGRVAAAIATGGANANAKIDDATNEAVKTTVSGFKAVLVTGFDN